MEWEERDLTEYLEYIPCSSLSYQDWINVGMALKHEGYPCNIWEAWSRQDSRFREGECQKKWQTFNGSAEPVTAGTIVQMAKDYGYDPARNDELLDWDDEIGVDKYDIAWVEPEEVEEAEDLNPYDQIVSYLNALFEPDENVSIVMKSFKDEDGKYKPSGRGSTFNVKALLKDLTKHKTDVCAALGDYDPQAGAWVRFNPMDGKGVKNDNVTAYKYALVESDEVEIPMQNALIREMKLPVAALVNSGGKSLHAIVKIDAPTHDIYRKRIEKLYAVCDRYGLKVDRQNKNASRLSRLVCDASGKVEQALNEEAGIGLKVQVPELDQDRLNGLIDHVSDHEDPFTDEKAQELADLAENFTHHVVDAFIEKNADAHYAAGLSPKIERDAMAECCAWCLDLAGTYDYPLKDRSVYQRHKDCRCVVDYHPGNGKVQNVHSKEWRDETDSDILEARKTANLEPLVDPAKVEQRKQAENPNAEQKFGMLIQDVTDEYLNNAKPNSGSVNYEDGFVKRLYPDEIRVAEWIHKTFGGDVLLLTEGYVERPDYNWNDKLWDLKFPEKEKSIGKRIQKGLSQIYDNPGGIIVDSQKLDISTERLEQIITGRMKTSLKHQADVIIIDGDKLIKIIRYNKN
ncbi:MAG: PriCT-2 domain-containing protein [Lachnospiraceae bacterium]|nr:PriCT-2 domain-containing protein [Lachnospiraceae bacterium]